MDGSRNWFKRCGLQLWTSDRWTSRDSSEGGMYVNNQPRGITAVAGLHPTAVKWLWRESGLHHCNYCSSLVFQGHNPKRPCRLTADIVRYGFATGITGYWREQVHGFGFDWPWKMLFKKVVRKDFFYVIGSFWAMSCFKMAIYIVTQFSQFWG